MKVVREYCVPGRWGLHAYYTLRPFAPDGSGRLLMAAADLATQTGRVYVMDADGRVLDSFGEHRVESSFYHTGFWQTWSPDARRVYYQSGSLARPTVTRRDLATGKEVTLDGDMEGAPPDGEPVLSALLGMLYAAGYGYGVYNPGIAPVPFAARDRHGVFSYTFDPPSERLVLSVAEMVAAHTNRAWLEENDRALAARNGTPAGLTLMAYCVRWNPDGSRFLFHFGNHCVVKSRGEPKVTCIYTCRRDFTDMHLAVDLQRGGVHWSWHPDGEHLVGYALPEDAEPGAPYRLSTVRYDGTGRRAICDAEGGGHPSISPADPLLAATDRGDRLLFWDLAANRIVAERTFPLSQPGYVPSTNTRNAGRACMHPVFARDGKTILINSFDGDLCRLLEIEVPERR